MKLSDSTRKAHTARAMQQAQGYVAGLEMKKAAELQDAAAALSPLTEDANAAACQQALVDWKRAYGLQKEIPYTDYVHVAVTDNTLSIFVAFPGGVDAATQQKAYHLKRSMLGQLKASMPNAELKGDALFWAGDLAELRGAINVSTLALKGSLTR